MRHLDAITFSRWIVTGVLLGTPLLVGCSAKSEPSSEISSPSVDVQQQPPGAPGVAEIAPTEPTPSQPDSTDRELSDAELVAETFGTKSDEVAPEADAVDDAERPRSLFRSIGRALQRGVTDAAGVPSGVSNDVEPQPDSGEPK